MSGYNLEILNIGISLMAGVTIISYILYTISPDVHHRLRSDKLYITSLFVILGILRYLQITFIEKNSTDPSEVIIKDKFLQIIIILWLISFYLLARVIK